MKKLLKILIILTIIGFAVYYIYVNYINKNKIIPEEEPVSVDEYYIYGNHLNIKGNLKIDDEDYLDAKIVLFNGEEKEYDIVTNVENDKLIFYTSEYINEGMYIDDLQKDNYYMFLMLEYENKDSKDKPIKKYYILNNKTEYKESTYYTLSKYNNKVLINSDNDYNTLMLNIKENKDKNIYDITIDPGHGGMDSGAVFSGQEEKKLTLNISKKIQKKLELKNLKVKLTHDENDITKDSVMEEYGQGGRAVIPNEVKSKYTFSIHINKNESSNVKGIEIYTPANINYDLAESIANNIVDNVGFSYSTNKKYKVKNGIYTHNFTESEIKESLKGYEEKGYRAYNVTTNSNYLYMIRETGGYLTGAYVDDSNPNKVGINPYYNSNIANESYLLEIGYMSNTNDLNILETKEDKIATAITDAIIKELGL